MQVRDIIFAVLIGVLILIVLVCALSLVLSYRELERQEKLSKNICPKCGNPVEATGHMAYLGDSYKGVKYCRHCKTYWSNYIK